MFNFTSGNYTISVETSINDTEVTLTNNSAYRDFILVCPQCTSDAQCDDGIACNGLEACVNSTCVTDVPPVDCNPYDNNETNTCFNVPDGNNLTLDYYPGFNSTCVDYGNNTAACTEEAVNITSACSLSCDAECESDNDCEIGWACTSGCACICVPSDEICDGLDNDCDGLVDESDDATNITIESTTDDIEEVYLDGSLISGNDDWHTKTTSHADVSAGTHILAFRLNNTAPGSAGLLATVRDSNNDILFNTQANGSWVYSANCSGDWQNLTFNDSAWNTVKKVGNYGSNPWLFNVAGWIDFDADWVWSNTSSDDLICVRRVFDVAVPLSQSCGQGNCTGVSYCTDGAWSGCSTDGKDIGLCATCDQDGVPTYDDAQDDECSANTCPIGACGLFGCAPDEYASFVDPYIDNMCADIYLCTDNQCVPQCIPDDLSLTKLSFRSTGHNVSYIGDDNIFADADVDFSGWFTKRYTPLDVDGVTSLQTSTKTPDGKSVLLNIHSNVLTIDIGCEIIHGTQVSTIATYYKTGQGRKSTQCTSEFWIDRIHETISISGTCEGMPFAIDGIDDVTLV